MTPQLRFPQFTDDWQIKRLGDIAIFHDGKRIPIESGDRQKIQGKYPYYGASGVIDYVNDYIFDGEYVLLAEDGANIIMRSSPIAFVIQGKSWVNNHAHVMQARGSNHFLATCLENLQYEKYNTGTAQPKLNAEICKKIPIVIPSVKEQEKISEFLTTVNERIALIQKKAELLKKYKTGVMQKIFTQQIRFKDEDGDLYPDWEEKKFSDVLKIGSGQDYKHLKTGDIPVYGTGGLMLYVDDYLYDGKSVCIGRKGTIDQPRFIDGKFWTVDTLFYTYGYIEAIPEFIYLVFQQINWQKYNEASGVPSLSRATIEKIKINIPITDEQQKIANFFIAVDDKIKLEETKVEKAKEFKKSLLQRMFV